MANTSLTVANKELLKKLQSGSLSITAFSEDILVLECFCAGTSFRELEDTEPEMQPENSVLLLKREASNEFDPNAVQVYFQDVHIGYLPKAKNEVIARLMDAGKQFYAKISSKKWEGNYLKLFLKVYMKD